MVRQYDYYPQRPFSSLLSRAKKIDVFPFFLKFG